MSTLTAQSSSVTACYFDQLVRSYQDTHHTKNGRRPSLKSARKTVAHLQALGLLPFHDPCEPETAWTDPDFDRYADESPELPDHFDYEPEPDDWAWVMQQGDAGFPVYRPCPADLEAFTLSAYEWHHDETDEPFDDHPHGALIGEVA